MNLSKIFRTFRNIYILEIINNRYLKCLTYLKYLFWKKLGTDRITPLWWLCRCWSSHSHPGKAANKALIKDLRIQIKLGFLQLLRKRFPALFRWQTAFAFSYRRNHIFSGWRNRQSLQQYQRCTSPLFDNVSKPKPFSTELRISCSRSSKAQSLSKISSSSVGSCRGLQRKHNTWDNIVVCGFLQRSSKAQSLWKASSSSVDSCRGLQQEHNTWVG